MAAIEIGWYYRVRERAMSIYIMEGFE